MQRRSPVPSISHDEIDARAAVQLADHHALGPVDDELAAAEHDGDVAQVDFLLDRLLLGQAEPDLERPAVGQPQLPALVGLVARFAQFVAEVLQPQRLVVAFDGEDFPQHALDPLVLPLLPGHFVLQKGVVAAGLDFGQVGNGVGGREAAEATDFLGLEPSLGGGGHRNHLPEQNGEIPEDGRERTRHSGTPSATGPPGVARYQKMEPFLPAQDLVAPGSRRSLGEKKGFAACRTLLDGNRSRRLLPTLS